jgi:predicted NBD/HSP70 family sugar kinase
MRLGIDLGGTKTEIIAIDPNGRELFRERRQTPSGNYDEIVRMIGELVKGAETRLKTSASIGIGIPGAASLKTGLIKNANTVCMIGKPLQSDLETLLKREVRLANDANCFALSEATDGAAAGAKSVFAVIIGTGTGGGVVIDGKLLEGANAIAGEWGHNPLPWPSSEERPGRPCYCGKSGCIETFLSGPGFKADHVQHTAQDISPEEIVTRSELGDPHAEATLSRYEERMAKSLATVINILDPEVVVLGGGLSNIGRLYKNVPKIWSHYAFSDGIETRLVKALHGDSSGVRGAAWLWPAIKEHSV